MSQNSPDSCRKKVFGLFLPISGELLEKGLSLSTFKRRLKKIGFELSLIPDFCSGSFADIGMRMKRLFTGWKSIFPLAIFFWVKDSPP